MKKKKKKTETVWMRKETCKKEQQSKEDTSREDYSLKKNKNKTMARNYYYLQAQRECRKSEMFVSSRPSFFLQCSSSTVRTSGENDALAVS